MGRVIKTRMGMMIVVASMLALLVNTLMRLVNKIIIWVGVLVIMNLVTRLVCMLWYLS
jgi:hypothetical protein